jgi:HD-GYP domain-containing protein (c-di-GMP phosphodiesterase class II)
LEVTPKRKPRLCLLHLAKAMSSERKIEQKIEVAVLSLCGLAVALVVVAAIWSDNAFTADCFIALGVLGAFALAATNFDVTARAGLGISGNVMVLIAALVVFREYGLFLGPVIVACLGALDFSQLRQRAWQKVAFNASADALTMLAAALVFWAMTGSPTSAPTVVLLIATVLGATTYLVVNALLISIPVALTSGEEYTQVLRELLIFNCGAFPFALLGLGLGWVYLELGPAVVPLLVVPILIARSTFASYLELKAGQEQTIETLIHALEAKDRYTAGHAQRVATFSEYVGAEFAFGERRMERLRYAALMHDIGKLVVPNQLLNKPGRLTEAEFERVKRHEPVSVELLRRIDFLAPVAGDTTTEAATAAVDGSGLVEPAIIHVADAFDAMTSTRAYRRALSQETAFAELRAGSGTQFNAQCVEAFIAAIERRNEHYGAGHEVDEHDWAVAPPEAGTGSAGLGHLVPEEQAAGQ